MNLKKIIASLLLPVMALASLTPAALAIPAGAYYSPAPEEAVIPQPESPYVVLRGTIESVTIADGVVHVQVLSEKFGDEPQSSTILNITANTKILDSVTRKLVNPKDLKQGSTVIAWHSPVSTRSLPPITNAEALIVNVPKEGAPGEFIEVEKVIKNKDGSVTVLNHAQDLLFTIQKNTKIRVLGSKKTLRLSDIKPGTKLAVWYTIAAMSYPAQAGGNEVAAFASDYKGYVSVIDTEIRVNGRKLSEQAFVEEGAVWLPARAVARKLGFSTSYKSGVLTLRKSGKTVAVLTQGQDTFLLRGEESYTAAPVVKDGILYVQMSLLSQLGSFKLAHPVW